MQYNQTFKFRCNTHNGKFITVTGYDYDTGSSNDWIGEAKIDLSSLLNADPDYRSYILLDKEKQPIKGYDKQVRAKIIFRGYADSTLQIHIELCSVIFMELIQRINFRLPALMLLSL